MLINEKRSDERKRLINCKSTAALVLGVLQSLGKGSNNMSKGNDYHFISKQRYTIHGYNI